MHERFIEERDIYQFWAHSTAHCTWCWIRINLSRENLSDCCYDLRSSLLCSLCRILNLTQTGKETLHRKLETALDIDICFSMASTEDIASLTSTNLNVFGYEALQSWWCLFALWMIMCLMFLTWLIW